MAEPRRKPHKRYLFYRVYCVAALLAWNVVGVLVFIRIITAEHGDFPERLLMLLPVSSPLVLPALFMIFNLAAFPLKFSVFGPYERASFPNEPPLYTKAASSGGIWWLRATVPFVTWKVYPSGLGMSILGVGGVFIPAQCIVELRQGAVSHTLRHTSPELRNPVLLPRGRLVVEVEAMLEQHRRDAASSA